jgi:tetratricopeptide (TPR) repeat protein
MLDVRTLIDIYHGIGDQAREDWCITLLMSIGAEQPTRTRRFLAEMLYHLAVRAFADFRIALAERAATRAMQLFEALEGVQAPETVEAVHLLANIQRATFQGELAEHSYRRALEGYQALAMNDEAVGTMVDLGKVYRDSGSYALAQYMFESALERLRSSTSASNQTLASCLGNLAELYYKTQRYELADQTYAKALQTIADEPQVGERPWLLHGRALLKYHLGEYTDAARLYREAKALWVTDRGEYHPFVSTVASNLGLVHWATGAVGEAVAAFAEVEELRDREMQRILAVGSERKRVAYARNLQSDLQLV